MKLWAEKDILKGEVDKARIVIEWEVGPGKTVEELLKDDSGWKGRAQKIETLKQKLKKAKDTFGDGVSSFSETASKSNAERNLEKIDMGRARENE